MNYDSALAKSHRDVRIEFGGYRVDPRPGRVNYVLGAQVAVVGLDAESVIKFGDRTYLGFLEETAAAELCRKTIEPAKPLSIYVSVGRFHRNSEICV